MTSNVRNSPNFKPKTLAIVTYPDVQMSAVLGLSDLVSVANSISAKLGGGEIEAVCYSPASKTHNETVFDALVMPPNMNNARGKDDSSIHEWIKRQHSAGAIACSICAGVFWLGHAGIIQRRPVTTHWALEREFRETFPSANLHAEHILIDDNDIVTAGGMMAWLDMGLFLVERWLGQEVVTHTARHLLIDPRGREQRNYRSFRPNLAHGNTRILSLQHWMEGNLDADLTVDALASSVSMTSRTFLRKFGAATGYSPNSYVQNLRVEKARGLLERTHKPVSAIGWEVGYKDVSAFSRVFKETIGVGARDYRTRFNILDR